jgi:hypothetical protein
MFPTGNLIWPVVAILLLAASIPASAQGTACATIQPVPGVSGYQVRQRDSRCEGFYQSPVAGGGLELFSLTVGSVNYKLEANNTIYVAAPNVGELKSDKLQVRARAIPLGTYYRMDTTIPSSGLMTWPMATVLAPAKLTADTIGIVAWVERDANEIFVPLSVSEQRQPASSGPSLVAILRSAADLDEFQWRSWPDGGAAPPGQLKKLPNKPAVLRAGGPIRLEIETSKGGRRVEIAAKVINSDRWLKLNLRMFEP